MSAVPRSEPARRAFLKSAAVLGAGLAVGFVVPGAKGAAEATGDGTLAPNAFVRVFPDNTIKLVVHKHDSGTGTRTALGLVLAEELEVALEQVEIITPENPFFKDYMHPQWHVFSTGGSTSVMLEYEGLRKAGASARMMLVEAAAARWQVPVAECRAQAGQVTHAPTGRSFTYGALATEAARLPAPKEPVLKAARDFHLIGKLHRKLDARAKVTGRQVYGIDVKVPGMLVAVVLRAPVIGGRVRHIDARKALAVRGVRQVLKVPAAPGRILGGNQEGVAVLADNYWAAKQGRDALRVRWHDGPFANFDSAAMPALQRAHLDEGKVPLVRTIDKGDAPRALRDGARVLQAEYTMPYKVPNPLEPECVVVAIQGSTITYWGGLQVPSNVQVAAAEMAGIGADRVVLKELTGGGSFGARESRHWLLEATWLAKATGKPVKLMYSREDEVRALFYHAASYNRVAGAVDAQGRLTALQLRAVSPASPEEWEPGYHDRKDRMDYSTTEAICAWDFAYQPAHLDVGWVRHETGVPTGSYRAVSFIPNVFAIESFMDELATRPARTASPSGWRTCTGGRATWPCSSRPPPGPAGARRLGRAGRWGWPRTRPTTAISPSSPRWKRPATSSRSGASPAWPTAAWPSTRAACRSSCTAASCGAWAMPCTTGSISKRAGWCSRTSATTPSCAWPTCRKWTSPSSRATLTSPAASANCPTPVSHRPSPMRCSR